MNFDWFVDVTHLIGMSKDKVDVIRPACMPGDVILIKSTHAECPSLQAIFNSKFVSVSLLIKL